MSKADFIDIAKWVEANMWASDAGDTVVDAEMLLNYIHARSRSIYGEG